ncbi:MAG: PAS domain-containing protein [Lachnospiraceae bacterium]|nr:PAS domain-containing protein [Lachnospiraceae bacterium]
MTNQEMLAIYAEMVDFIAVVCGPACEIVLHDVTDPEHSIIRIANPLSGRKVGDAMTDLSLALQEKGIYSEAPFLSNYEGRSKGKNFLSSTYFIKNEGQLIGLLCVNKDMTAASDVTAALHALLDRFNLYPASESEYKENLDTSMEKILTNRIADIVHEGGYSPKRMNREEKIAMVRQMNEEGLLSVKGAVQEIAAQLGVSVPTVYRYLKM